MAREPLLITAPVRLPIPVGDASDHLRGPADSIENPTIEAMIKTATDRAESYCRSKFIEQTWDHYFDALTATLRLRYPPVASITSVTKTDVDGNSDTVTASIYEIGRENKRVWLREAYNQTWPTDVRLHPDVVQVRVVHGYGDRDDIPEPIKQAIRIHVAHEYEHREGAMEVPAAFFRLLTPYRFAEVVS